MADQNITPAGWHPDPNDPSQQRYWDGQQWTEQTHPAAPSAGATVPPTNSLAIISLILAFFVPLVGAIIGHVALSQIKRTGESGRGLALAGVIIGWLLVAIGAAFFLLLVVAVGTTNTY